MSIRRYPKTIDQAIIDLMEAISYPDVSVVPTNELMLEMLQTIKRNATVQP